MRLRGYVSSRPIDGSRVPQHIQGLVLRDYCRRNQTQYLLGAVEYCMDNCFLMLEQLMEDIGSVHGLLFYSLFMLPDSPEHRERILQRVVQEKRQLHFAVEDISLVGAEGLDRIKDIWLTRDLHKLGHVDIDTVKSPFESRP